MIDYRFEPGAVHLLRLHTGEDLYETVSAFVREAGISVASVSFLGAVRRASLRYYDQDQRQYVDFEVDEHLEIVSGVGNVSMLDDQPFLHIHGAFTNDKGTAVGGHVNVGTEVFLCEVTVAELIGTPPPIRSFDEETGLMVWGNRP